MFFLLAGLMFCLSIARLVSGRTPLAGGFDDSFLDSEQPDEPVGRARGDDWRILFVRQLRSAQLVVDRLDASGVTEFECSALGPAAYAVMWRVPEDDTSAKLGLHIHRSGEAP